MKTALEKLKSVWGYNSFKPKQEEIIQSVLNGKDTIALLPTGGGKSICYQIPALISEGVCLVVSPLIALIQDQIENLKQKNIEALTIDGSYSFDDTIIAFDNLKFKEIKFLFLSPEKLQNPLIQEKIKSLDVSLIAIDEAHCISEWGHDFRPAYLKLSFLKNHFPNTPFIALTATATKRVLQDIETELGLQLPQKFKNSYERKKLAYQVFKTENKFLKVEQMLKKINAPTIIYTNSRKETQKISTVLNQKGYSTTFYHGGLSNEEKKQAYTDWFDEKKPVMVATNAFGMGIDKSNIRLVIHLKLPNTIENYIQESGRAGRDGHKAFAVTLFNDTDLEDFKKNIHYRKISIDTLKKTYRCLHQYFNIALGEKNNEFHAIDFEDITKRYQLYLNDIYQTLRILHLENIISYNELGQKNNCIQFIASHTKVLHYSDTHPNLNLLIKTILRSYGGVFESQTPINLFSLSRKTKSNVTQITGKLKLLEKDGIIWFSPASQQNALQFLVPREDDLTINTISKKILHQQKHQENKAYQFLNYIENNSTCRSVQLLAYFGEQQKETCGICDVCIGKKPVDSQTIKTIENEILSHLKKSPTKSSELVNKIKASESLILTTLENLLSEEIIFCNDIHEFRLKK